MSPEVQVESRLSLSREEPGQMVKPCGQPLFSQSEKRRWQ
jgi:hypothetical protein